MTRQVWGEANQEIKSVGQGSDQWDSRLQYCYNIVQAENEDKNVILKNSKRKMERVHTEAYWQSHHWGDFCRVFLAELSQKALFKAWHPHHYPCWPWAQAAKPRAGELGGRCAEGLTVDSSCNSAGLTQCPKGGQQNSAPGHMPQKCSHEIARVYLLTQGLRNTPNS